MELSEAKSNGIVVIGVKGRIDASNTGDLEHKLLDLIAAGERRLVLDLAELDYISSAGLRTLLVAAKRLGNDKLALAALKDQIREVLDIAGFSSLFQIYPTRQAAVGV